MKIKKIITRLINSSASRFSSTKKIGVISALPEEQLSFLEKVNKKQNVSKGIIKAVLGDHIIYATLSGMGKVNAASVAQELISKYQVDFLLFTGVAGGVNKSLNIGDIVVASSAFQHDYGYLNDEFKNHAIGTLPEIGIGTGNESLYFDLTKNWNLSLYNKIKNKLSHSKELLTPVKIGSKKYNPILKMNGVIATGDQFIANVSKLESLRKLKADVVEMEGAAVAQVAIKNDIPVFIIRSVSDKAGQEANLDFKSFLSTVAHNNSLLSEMIIKTIKDE
jgi:adenosylhomocysteine nucleosidase